jgi:hypothetical protein
MDKKRAIKKIRTKIWYKKPSKIKCWGKKLKKKEN